MLGKGVSGADVGYMKNNADPMREILGSGKVSSPDGGEHSQYFLSKRPGADIVEFDVPKWLDDFVKEYEVPQAGYKSNPLNQGGMAPKINDITTPGKSIEFPSPWIEWIEEYATNGRIIKGVK